MSDYFSAQDAGVGLAIGFLIGLCVSYGFSESDDSAFRRGVIAAADGKWVAEYHEGTGEWLVYEKESDE